MNETGMEACLVELLDTLAYPNEDFLELENNCCGTFSERGILTHNKGIVLKLKDGSEFQITIVQSVSSDNSEEDDFDEIDD